MGRYNAHGWRDCRAPNHGRSNNAAQAPGQSRSPRVWRTSRRGTRSNRQSRRPSPRFPRTTRYQQLRRISRGRSRSPGLSPRPTRDADSGARNDGLGSGLSPLRQHDAKARHHPRAHEPAPTLTPPGIPNLLLARPYSTETEAQDNAQEEAEWNDYDVQRCRKCFHVAQALTARHRRARERARPLGLAAGRAATTQPPGVPQRPAPPVIASIREFRAEFSRDLHVIGCCGRIGKLHPSAIRRLPVANHLRRASCPLVGSQWLGGCSVYPTSSARGPHAELRARTFPQQHQQDTRPLTGLPMLPLRETSQQTERETATTHRRQRTPEHPYRAKRATFGRPTPKPPRGLRLQHLRTVAGILNPKTRQADDDNAPTSPEPHQEPETEPKLGPKPEAERPEPSPEPIASPRMVIIRDAPRESKTRGWVGFIAGAVVAALLVGAAWFAFATWDWRGFAPPAHPSPTAPAEQDLPSVPVNPTPTMTPTPGITVSPPQKPTAFPREFPLPPQSEPKFRHRLPPSCQCQH